MKSFIYKVLVILISAMGLIAGDQAIGQVDPSKALLLRSSGKAPEVKDLDSSRYQVKPSQARSGERPVQSSGRAIPEPTQTRSQIPTEAEPSPTQVVDNQNETETRKVNPVGSSEERSSKQLEDYRQNIVDLHIAPIYFYNESSSNYWYRGYRQASTGFQVAADIWLTPELGLSTNYMTTTAASIDGSVANDGRVSVENDWFSGEIMTRRSFSGSPEDSSLILAIGYQEYEMKVASVATERIGINSSGLKVRAEAVLPTSSTYQWSLGVEYMPRVTHKEIKSQIAVKSGTDNESSMMGVHLGGRFLISRRHQVFWRLQHKVEKNLFSGTSNLNDPRSDLNPVTGVEVTNSFTIFSLGYTWGH